MQAKRIIDVTLEEFVDAVVNKLSERDEKETVSTEELAKILKCAESQIGVYGRAGMYEAPGCRVKKNCWNPKACKAWVSKEYQHLLEGSRKREMLTRKKK